MIQCPNLVEIKAPDIIDLGNVLIGIMFGFIPRMQRYPITILKDLDLSASSLTCLEVEILCDRCPSLLRLSLGLCEDVCNDESVQVITIYCLRLIQLCLTGGSLTSASLLYIAQLRHLTHLDLHSYDSFTGSHIQALVKSLTTLEVFKITLCDSNIDIVLKAIGNTCTHLREVSCQGAGDLHSVVNEDTDLDSRLSMPRQNTYTRLFCK